MAIEDSKTPNFTPKQWEWLDSQFQEKMTSATTSEAELRHNAGQRSVIAIIKRYVLK